MDRTPAARASLALVLAAFLAASALVFTRSFGFEYDDSYIWFRFVENLAHGHGASFNPGERHEGFSSVAWLLLGGAVRAVLDIDTRVLLKLLGGAAYAAAVCVVMLMAASAVAGAGRRGAVAAAAVAALLSLWITAGPLWAVSGMETGLYALALGLFVAAACGGGAWLVASAFTLAFLSRIEASILLPLPIAVDLLRATRGARALDGSIWAGVRGCIRERSGFWMRYLAGSLGSVCAVTLLRYQYFGDLVPATVRFKAPASAASNLTAGYEYLALFSFDFPAATILVLACSAVVLASRRYAVAAGAALVILVKLGFILWVGGDWMGFHRFIAPLVPLSGLVVALACVELASASRTRLWLALAGLLLAASLPSAWASYRQAWAWDGMGVAMREVNASIGATLGEWTLPDEVIAVGDVGAIPYYARRRTVDLHGLMDPYLVRYARNFSTEGHADIDVDYVLGKDPACFVIIASGPFRSLAGRRGAYPLYDRILEHPRFRRNFAFMAEMQLVDEYFYQIWCREAVRARLGR